MFLTVNKLQQVAPPNKGRATLHYTLPVSLLPSKLPLLLPRQDCKGRIRSCGGSIFNENATFAAATGLPHNPGILSRQKSQAIGYGPLEDNCLKIDKLQQAAPPNKGRAALRYTLSASQLSFRRWNYLRLITLPSLSLKSPQRMMIQSTMTQMPKPPRVRSMAMAEPVLPT